MSLASRVSLLGVTLILGVALGLQARTALTIRAHLRVLPQQVQELGHRLVRKERAQEALREEVHQLRQQIDALQKTVAADQPKLRALSDRLTALNVLAGFVQLEGPGVIVELSDSQEPLLPGQDPNELILHNYHLAMIVSDLWAAGADAVAINGERIVSTTPIKSVATTFMINTRRLTPPLQIAAIGDPDAMARHVSRQGGALDLLRAMKFPVRVTQLRRVTIPAFKGALTFRYTKVREKD